MAILHKKSSAYSNAVLSSETQGPPSLMHPDEQCNMNLASGEDADAQYYIDDVQYLHRRRLLHC